MTEELELVEKVKAFWTKPTSVCGQDPQCTKCCKSCAKAYSHYQFKDLASQERTVAWFKEISEHSEMQWQILAMREKYGWDNETGFLTPQGCRLPHHERSVVCLSSSCPVLRPIVEKMRLNYEECVAWCQRIKEIRKTENRLI